MTDVTKQTVPLVFERSRPGRTAYTLPALDVPEFDAASELGSYYRQDAPRLPELSELDVVRHFTALSTRNHGVDSGFYPLGSCTMKYNPKRNEKAAGLPGFAHIHPYQPEETVQGALALMHRLQRDLMEITGMDAVSLQPAAGAQGEWTGLLMIAAYHRDRGEKRDKVIVPDSSHGTNPASVTMAGLKAVTIPSDADGNVDLAALRTAVGPDTAALMLTNPSTLGLFETQIEEIARIVHEAGGLLYYDGANANAILGYTRPGDMGFDVVHLNLHKTFSTPHGGGGPGAGPVGVKQFLAPYLPIPTVEQDADGRYRWNWDVPRSIGKVKGFYGNFGVLVRAYAYIRTMGAEGLKQASESAVLAANYVMRRLENAYHLPFDRVCKHEFVLSAVRQKKNGVKTLDIAKRVLDFGMHPPTVYFPLIVDECMMIEPTDTESLETLEEFIAVMLQIADEAQEHPEVVRSAPHTTVVGRLDEVQAARQPVLRHRFE
ncbi:aminomethyl-transferring glycine dehydrogenase subunit GcvPB [Alicyclobacillus shizuokensis]|uniref:aminomethyl-transferring glycine dehydrogenase subunit GcvPB n=1 Tax=Alicyclobacillus shizuokensis TaxID=392014 RepID=UPI000832833F|nr:aminomethyl-transferring glycine dehydrogenase subunit GcvPB [Alicyclobacillus shizuokensis]MCL6625156.1 aminomethyl-transferring glycine dehydrogenase subunit GcvPB [Alicyclobacillus shizuokensis]